MASIYIWMDSKLQELSNNTKNTKFGARTKKLCKLQSIEVVCHDEATSSPQQTRRATNEATGSPHRRSYSPATCTTHFSHFQRPIEGGTRFRVKGRMIEDQIGPLGSEIRSFEGKNPP